MMLLAPLALLFLLSVPVVILLYLLRVRLREVEVGSTFLWERLLRDLSAQDPWQKPRFTLLMLIQLLILALLALALSRPAWQALAHESVWQVIVIDASASMQATDVAPSRFAQARALASATVRDLPAGSTVAMVAARSRPQVLVAATGDFSQALAALDQAQPSSTGLDLAAAIRLADAMAAGHAHGRVDVFTDGAFDRPVDLPEDAVTTRYHLVGGGANNRAITAISARPDPENNRRYQVFVRVQNLAAEASSATLGLYADGNLVDSRSLSLAQTASQELIFDRLPDDANVIQARLLEPDDLAVDNSASTVLERPHPTKILLVSPDNIFLQRALVLLPNVHLFRVAPGRYGAVDSEQFDLIIFNGYLPDSLPRQNLLLINPPDSALLPVEGTLYRPSISTWESASPLLRYISFKDVRVQQAAKVSAPGWAKTLVEAEGHPLLLAGELQGQRLLILPFALQQSNLPLSAAFPILIANAVGYLEPAGVLSERNVPAGSTLTIQPRPQAEEVLLERPNGGSASFPAGKSFRYDQTDQVGVYTVQQRARGGLISDEHFAVNVGDDGESDIRPRVPEDVVGQPKADNDEPVLTKGEVWPWFVLGGIGLLVGEWWWYHRRA